MSNEAFIFVALESGTRLDSYIAEKVPGLSRTKGQELIREGMVKVNERIARASTKLNAGDHVKIHLPVPQDMLLPQDIPVDIIYQDADVIVVNKPAGMTVHPVPGQTGNTLVNALLARIPEFPERDPMRPGIVHRLDKDASGLMVVARNHRAQLDLIGQFKARSVSKSYLVLVRGLLRPSNGVIEAPIGRDTRNRKKMAVVSHGEGRDARTHYHVIRYLGDYTLLEVKPETGRTHQIRVHLSAIGHPVAGDRVYGIKSDSLARMFLHASRLGFKLPSSSEAVEFTSPLPPELERVLEDIC